MHGAGVDVRIDRVQQAPIGGEGILVQVLSQTLDRRHGVVLAWTLLGEHLDHQGTLPSPV